MCFLLWIRSAGVGAYVCTEYHQRREMTVHRVCVLRVCSLIGVPITTLLQVKLGREMELGVIFWMCFLYLFHSQLIARVQNSSCKQVFVEWHVDLRLYVGYLQTCSPILLSTKSGARKLCIISTPWSRVVENLTGSQLVKKYPAFYGTRRFITAFTSARHLSLS